MAVKKTAAAVKKETVKPVEEAETKIDAVDVNRQSVIDMLKDFGIEADDAKSTKKLTEDLREHIVRLNSKVVGSESNLLKARIRSVKAISNISDEAFITRLVELGVPDLYLKAHMKNGSPVYLFSDSDSVLKDKDIWRKIRHSNINPIDTVSMFTKKIQRPEMYNFGSKNRGM